MHSPGPFFTLLIVAFSAGAIDVVPPVADHHLLVEEGSNRAEVRVLGEATLAILGADVEHLAPKQHSYLTDETSTNTELDTNPNKNMMMMRRAGLSTLPLGPHSDIPPPCRYTKKTSSAYCQR